MFLIDRSLIAIQTFVIDIENEFACSHTFKSSRELVRVFQISREKPHAEIVNEEWLQLHFQSSNVIISDEGFFIGKSMCGDLL